MPSEMWFCWKTTKLWTFQHDRLLNWSDNHSRNIFFRNFTTWRAAAIFDLIKPSEMAPFDPPTPENPTVETNIKCRIGWPVTEISPFKTFEMRAVRSVDNITYTLIIIIPRQCLWCCHHAWSIARVHMVHAMSAPRRQVAADRLEP